MMWMNIARKTACWPQTKQCLAVRFVAEIPLTDFSHQSANFSWKSDNHKHRYTQFTINRFFFDQRILINQSENFQVTGGTNFSGNKTLYFKKGVTESLDVVTVLSQFNFRNKTQINQTEVWFQKRNSNKANRCQLLWTEDKKPLKP